MQGGGKMKKQNKKIPYNDQLFVIANIWMAGAFLHPEQLGTWLMILVAVVCYVLDHILEKERDK